MNKKDVKTLIIPDIHGRIFWKSAIRKFPKTKYPNINIIFLGDYLDPYNFEGISREDAIENFQKIIKVAKSDKRIHLLFGNHDMHYWYDARFKSRVDNNNYKLINNIFENNISLFNVAFEEIINNERYLYTHAGVTYWWYKHIRLLGDIGLKNIKDKSLSEDRKNFIKTIANFTPTADELNKFKYLAPDLLWAASWIRGGDADVGSCIWADFEEWTYENSNIEGLWQIFGHTLKSPEMDEGVINTGKKYAMLDARQAWVINNKGEIIKLKDLK